jgi:hypothetical protein
MKIAVFLLIFLTVSSALPIITLEKLKHIGKANLRDGQMVEVSHSNTGGDLHHVSREYFVIKVVHKDKRAAYDIMQ